MCWFKKKSKNVLVADIGGTNTTFAVLDDKFSVLYKKEFKTQEIKDFPTIVKSVLTDVESFKIENACFAIASPVNADRTSFQGTHTGLHFTTDEIKNKTKLKRVLLIHDYEAIGFAIDIMKTEQYVELTSYGRNKKGTITIMGAGTGLGAGILAYFGRRHYPIGTEGGHPTISIYPEDKLELGLYKYLKSKNIPNEFESLVSGRGIVNIYNFLLTQKIKHSKKLESTIKRAKEEEKPKLITTAAMEEKDLLCLKVMDLFVKFFARAAKNIALSTKCVEFVIAGGIPHRILTRLQEGFIEEFTQHDAKTMRSLLESMTVLVITDYSISLYGAANALNYEI